MEKERYCLLFKLQCIYIIRLYLIICCLAFCWGVAQSVEVTSLNKPINLSGVWKFKIGDDLYWAEPNLDDTDWAKLKVPLNWESKAMMTMQDLLGIGLT